ncbi:DNA-binding transcriptional MerR regulator [Neobacillus niacini]|jgi:DNA-binding transcriptional MerR regulator|uniref:MerR family transcriptional regulator n=1 Tax=Neobacillus niacini TaxID=86668 RepID=UPI0027892239|nr:MerR family transcriptional regulator [Neobacillus niacini]MDQ1002537.1 DNA-binding transcriptional MerR regulator [Neobacillus niacini]
MTELFPPSHVQEALGIDSKTLRKFATLLEEHGYPIHRNSRGHRGYCEKDINTLRKFIDFSNEDGMTLELSAKAIMKWVSEENKSFAITAKEPLQASPDMGMSLNGDFNELMERIENLERINMDLINLLKEKAVREAYLEDKMNQILKYVERTEQLWEERNHVMLEETRKQIAAAKQKKWWHWWK